MKKQNKNIVTLASIFTGIVVLITTIVVLLPFLNKSTQIIVPDVENMTVKEATKKLQDAGFVVLDETVGKPSDDIEVGKVVGTKPVAGAKRKSGTEVTLYVSTGDANIKIDNYIGQNYEYVKGILESQGVSVFVEYQEIEEDDTTVYKQDEIIGQSIEAGSYVSKNDEITLTLPNITVKYPDFIGSAYTLKDIYEFCAKHNANCYISVDGARKLLTSSVASEYSSYSIISQSLKEGYTVTSVKDQVITLSSSNTDNGNNNSTSCEEDGFC